MRKSAKIILYAVSALFIVFCVSFVVPKFTNDLISAFSSQNAPASLIGVSEKEVIPEGLKPARRWAEPDPEVNAASSICVQGDKVLFKKNSDEKLPIASLTKLMAAVVVLENYDLAAITIVSKEAVDQLGQQGMLSYGEMMSIKDLLYIALIESSNDAAFALAEQIGVSEFVQKMNQKASELGFSNTSFADPSGLSSQNYSNSRELAFLAEYISVNHPEIWEILSLNNYRLLNYSGKLHHILINTNLLLGLNSVKSGKTGNTSEAKGCLLIIAKTPELGKELIYVILGSEERFSAMEGLIDWVNKAYIWHLP